MPAARTDISGGFATLDNSLERLGTAFLALGTAVMVTEDSDMVAMMAMMAGDSGVMTMAAGNSSMGGHDWHWTTRLRSTVS